MEASIAAALKAKKKVQGTLSYAISPAHNLELWGSLAKGLVNMGCHEIVIKDTSGLLSPQATWELVTALKPRRATLWLGVHCNHARELAPVARRSLAKLADAGIPLMGQTVLLAGVNDDVETLDQLMRALVTARVKPYYLHHPDLVRGTGHFRVSIERGQALMTALRGRLSGLAQPTYVLDVPGGHGKVPIGPAYLGDDPDALLVRDAFGQTHRYPG